MATALTPALDELTSAASLLSDEGRVLELAVRALYEACGRGLAFGFTSRGERSDRRGQAHFLLEGEAIALDPSHLAYVRTPAYDLAHVPPPQRNRWVEPFREGIATPEGLKKSTLYPLLARFRMLDIGRIAVCAGERQVAMLGITVPEGTTFSDDERDALEDAARALVVPMRMAALIADSTTARTPVERMLEASEEAVLALDGHGAVVGTSRPAFELLRQNRELPDRLRDAVAALARRATIVRAGKHVVHLSPIAEDASASYMAVVDGAGFADAPIALSERQRELLGLLEGGLSNADIGKAMGIAAATVKTMLERLYARAGVANRVELLSWARRAMKKA